MPSIVTHRPSRTRLSSAAIVCVVFVTLWWVAFPTESEGELVVDGGTVTSTSAALATRATTTATEPVTSTALPRAPDLLQVFTHDTPTELLDVLTVRTAHPHRTARLMELLQRHEYNAAIHDKEVFDPSWPDLVSDPSFGAKLSLQQIFDSVRRALLPPPSYVEHDFYAPVYVSGCTQWDCNFLLNQLAHIEDGYVGRFVITVNGCSERVEVLMTALRDAFRGRFLIRLNAENRGVASTWNLGLRVAHRTTSLPRLPNQPTFDTFCIIANADMQLLPGWFSVFVQFAQSRMHELVVNYMYSWSYYALSKMAFEELGYFDETHYPAYGEDIEYGMRWDSRFPGLGNAIQTDLYAVYDGTNALHFGSPTVKKSETARTMIYRFMHGRGYLYQKWNLSFGNEGRNPKYIFRYPFNNPRIWHNHSWIVDPVQRECILTGKGEVKQNFSDNHDMWSHTDAPCRFNVDLSKQLEKPDGHWPLSPARFRTKHVTVMESLLKRDGSWKPLVAENATFVVPGNYALVRIVDQGTNSGVREVVRMLPRGRHLCDAAHLFVVSKHGLRFGQNKCVCEFFRFDGVPLPAQFELSPKAV